MPQNAPPKVFVSATSADLRTSRLLVKDALLKIGCHPDDQDDFPPDWRSVKTLLEAKIADCAALIHIVGLRYGAEPDPTTLPPNAARRSYTHLEYDLACRLQEERGDTRFRVYVFVCPEDYAYNDGTEAEPEEQQAFQRAHRAALLADTRRYEQPATPQALKESVLALREPMLALQQEQEAVQTEVRRSHKTLLVVLALVVLLVVGGVIGYRHFATDMATVIQGLTVDAPRIKAHLREASERTLATALEAANKESTSEARERQREAAKAAHEARLLRIDDVAASFAALAGQPDANPIMQEMSRILQEEGVDAALAYAERKRPEILKGLDIAQAAYQQKVRAQLQPLLKATQLHAARGDNDAARQGYAELVARQPDWPELLRAFGWFTCDRSQQALMHGSLRPARVEAVRCLDLARRWEALAPNQPLVLRLLAAANHALGDVLEQSDENGAVSTALLHHEAGLSFTEARYKATPEDADAARDLSISLRSLGHTLSLRGELGDAQRALTYYERSLDICEHGLDTKPNDARALRDVMASLSGLADQLSARRQPGDTQHALSYYQRSLEIGEHLLAADPDSEQAARDVSVGLNRLGDLLVDRGQSGDAEQGLTYYQRGFGIRERLLAANPDSVQAARDLSVSLNGLGDLLAARNQSGDTQQALTHYKRGLEVNERLLAANPDSTRAARDVLISLNKLGDLLAARNQSGDVQQALLYYHRDLEISERLLTTTDSDDAQVERDISVTLTKLGTILMARGHSGHKQQALSFYQRGLAIRERLYTGNPSSAQAAHDVVASLEYIVDAEQGQGAPALATQIRALHLAEALHARNPDSAFHGRTLAISQFRTALLAKAAGDENSAREYRAASLATLDAMINAGAELDAPMLQLHAELKKTHSSK